MQHLFFQITITLNPIIIHKLWEKIFNQSWWEIKVRRPRHGNDSIFAHTLRGLRGDLDLVTVFKRLTFCPSALWPLVTRWCDPPLSVGASGASLSGECGVSSPEPDTEPEPELGRHQAPAPDHGDAGPVQPGHLTNTLHHYSQSFSV